MQTMMRKFRKNRKKGFTLVELIVVIAILAILAAILIPTLTGLINDAKETAAMANARSVYSGAMAAMTYIIAHPEKTGYGSGPTSVNVTALAKSDYIGNSIADTTYTIAVNGTYPNYSLSITYTEPGSPTAIVLPKPAPATP